MASVVIAVHAVICVAIVIVVLLQKGKGADIGAVFGGSSQTVFGSSGAGNFLTRTTWGLMAMFFLTSMFLAYASNRHVSASIFDRPIRSAPAPVKRVPMDKLPAAPAPAPAKPAPKQ